MGRNNQNSRYMLGKTHLVLGMASSLVLIQPQTIPGIITVMIGGAVGGCLADVDIKNREIEKTEEEKQENVYDAIINALFIFAFIAIDFFIGKGICQYIIENWGVKVWGALLGIIILLLIGLNTKHRTFTHSLLAMVLFSGLVYMFCRPAVFPFLIGYASHLISDFFNKLGLQLFFPAKWRPCLKLCRSDKTANKVVFWISLGVDVILGAYLFSKCMTSINPNTPFISLLTDRKFLSLNILQLYLILINLLTFLAFESHHRAFLRDEFHAYEHGRLYRYKDYDTAQSRFQVWLMDFLVFLGGGVGMLVSLIKNREVPSGLNANWCAFCYSSILFWLSIYCYICNPFALVMNSINWLSKKHIPLLVYLGGINAISALVMYSLRNKRFNEEDRRHTGVFFLGAFGGTIESIIMAFRIRREEKFFYVKTGFFVMLISHIILVLYLMSVGIV